MEFRLSREQEALRREVHDWLKAELGTDHDSLPEPMPPGYMPDREFELKMGKAGWLAISWPKEYGGGGRPIADQFLVEKEIALHGGNASDALTRDIIAPMIIAAANDDQKRRFLPKMARGALTACLGYSEPESGSDFASLQTRAVRDGDDYVINGRKIWTSGAESSEYCWLAARTDSEGTKHGGISVFMVPMGSPGVEVRPIVNLLDKHWFNEVVFDDVRVSAADRIGAEGEGWRVLTSALGLERITVYRAYVHWRTLLGAVRWAKDHQVVPWSDSTVRQRLAQLRIEYEIAELLLERSIQMHTEGRDYRGEAAMVKLFNTEFAQRLYETSLNLLGMYGPLMEGDRYAPYDAATAHNFLSAVQDTIGAGTSEVQRDLIAIRALGLPRG
ncbi:MAG TPA: acyl-CoA dehydrogenase family protein [Dehalococcoidia bacterium]|nr:acyl-CoA dehydrogenase family protein [Dehalococcoidia bacterium]